MSITSVLARGRAAAERRMLDTCTIRRAGAPVYTGRCEVAQAEGEAQEEADAYALDLRLVLKVPVSAAGLELGDEATIDTAVNDPDLVGKVLRVQGLARESHATCRRLFCTERTGPQYLRGDDDRAWTA